MFYYESGNGSDKYNNPSPIPTNRRAKDPNVDSFSYPVQPTHSSLSQQQPPQSQQTLGNNAIYYQYDDLIDSREPHSSEGTPFSPSGQDIYMDDFYKDMSTWDANIGSCSYNNSATQNQLLSSFDSKPQQEVDMFLSFGQQDILLSDPNFVRQQQLLQEQQRETLQREAQQEYMDDADTSHASALFDEFDNTIGFGRCRDEDPSHNMNDNRIRLSYPPATPAPEAKRQQYPKPTGIPKDASVASRSMPPAASSTKLKRNSSPIPISSSSSSSSYNAGDGRSSEIDHQRRQNELQARFRVNYKKSGGGNGSHQAAAHKSSANLSTSASSQQQAVAAAAAFGSSVPTLPSGRKENEAGFSAGTSPLHSNHDISIAAGARATSFPSRTMPIQIHRVQRATNAMPVDAEQHQRELDEQLEKVNFDDITVTELKEMLRQRGKSATGKKIVLVQRLQDERDLIKAGRNGKAHRYSQPPPASSRHQEPVRPRSYQGSSPRMIHAMPQSPLMNSVGGNASSMPTSSLMHPGSPNSVTMSLNRSIANMHIGSPPLSAAQHSRRYSPYTTPVSPRVMASSPKSQSQNYSSSVPSNNTILSSSPSNSTNNYGAQLSSSYTSRYRPYNTYARTKNYAPFTSSALATPDRDDDRDPFDDYTAEQEKTSTSSSAISPGHSEYKTEMDSAIDNVLYGNSPAFNFGILEGFTEEDIMTVLTEQGLSMDLHNSGYSSNDMVIFDNHFSSATPR